MKVKQMNLGSNDYPAHHSLNGGGKCHYCYCGCHFTTHITVYACSACLRKKITLSAFDKLHRGCKCHCHDDGSLICTRCANYKTQNLNEQRAATR